MKAKVQKIINTTNKGSKMTTILIVIGVVLFVAFSGGKKSSTINNATSSQKSTISSNINQQPSPSPFVIRDQVVLAKFNRLSQNGNSSCSGTFKDSIPTMPEGNRLEGSCCSPMSMHRYSEQTEGLKKYKDISEIPSDPYDIDAALAKKLMSSYDMQLTPEEQKTYDYAMEHSNEKGPCCCKCWRWFVYGGLGKYLIKEKGFTGEQVTDIWNLSDGCGGEGDHVDHTS